MIEDQVPLYGRIVVIKRSGQDGSIFPLWSKECIIGRDDDCDIRIQLMDVSAQHARVSVDEDSKVYIESIGRNGVRVNGIRICDGGEAKVLEHKDIFEISDRSFRLEYLHQEDQDPQIHPNWALNPKGEERSEGSLGSGAFEHRKRVSFGPVISPEYIDRTLPPSTPIKKGALPDVVPGTPLSHIKRRFHRKIAATPQHDSILETENEPVGVLVRHANDTPLVKESSGFRTSPRNSNEEKANKDEDIGTSLMPSSQMKRKYSLESVATKIKTPKKTLSLSKKPSNFYGASAAKTPRGAKKPLPKTPKKITLKTPQKTSTKTPRKVSSKIVKASEKLTNSKKKPSAISWADVLKRNGGKTPKATKVARESQLALEKARMQIGIKKKNKKSYGTKKAPIQIPKYRHAESPEDIVIHRRRSRSNPQISPSSSKSLQNRSNQDIYGLESTTSTVDKEILSSPSTSLTKSKSPSVVEKSTNNKSSKVKTISRSNSSRKSIKMSDLKRSRSKSVSSTSKKIPSKRRARSQSTSKTSSSLITGQQMSSIVHEMKSPRLILKRFSLCQSSSPIEDVNLSTPPSSNRGRPKKRPSTTTSSSTSDRNSISPSKSLNIETPSSSKRGRLCKTPSTVQRSLSTSDIANSSNSPAKSLDFKTPSSSKRGRPRKTPSATPRSLSTSDIANNSNSPAKSLDFKTPSSSKRGRPRKTPSATPRSSSASDIARKGYSPSKSHEIKTPSSSRRGRPRKISSATPRSSSASDIAKNYNSPKKSHSIKTPLSSKQGRPRKTPLTAQRSLSVLNTDNLKRSKSCSNITTLGSKKRKDIRLSSSNINISRSQYHLQNFTPLAPEKSLILNSASNSPSVFINASLDGISIPSSSKTPANSPSSGISSMNFSQRFTKSLRESLGGLQNSSFFDFDSVKTPNIPIQVLVSPLLAESIHIDGRILKHSRSKPGKRVSLNNIEVQRYNEISHKKRHSVACINLSEGNSNILSTPKKRKNNQDNKSKCKKFVKKVNKSPISSYDNLTGVKELFTTPEKLGEMITENNLESIFTSPEYIHSLVMQESLLSEDKEGSTKSKSSSKSVKKSPSKRSTRSRATKKESAVVEEQPIKRSTRRRNKSDNEKSPRVPINNSNIDEVASEGLVPKRSIRGRKSKEAEKVVNEDESPKNQRNEQASEEVEEVPNKKRSTRSKNTHSEEDESSKPIKTRGRKPKSSKTDVGNTLVEKTSRSTRNNKKGSVFEEVEDNSSVELSSHKNNESDVQSPDDKSNRGTQTTLSDSDKSTIDTSEKVASTRKRSSRKKQSECDSIKKAPIKRMTRKKRVEFSESENIENDILEKSPIQVIKPLRTRGRQPKLSGTEVVVVSPKKEPSPAVKPRRTRRAKKNQDEEEEPTKLNTPKTRAKSTEAANDNSEPQQSTTKRRGRKKKDNLESSVSNKENVDVGPTGRRKRNVQIKATEVTESSPPKRGRRALNTEETEKKKTEESPIKRVTRSRAKRC